MLTKETPADIEVTPAADTSVTVPQDIVTTKPSDILVAGKKREYAIVGDAFFPTINPDEIPPWLHGMVDAVVDLNFSDILFDLEGALDNLIDAMSEIDIAKNSYAELINIEETIDRVIATKVTQLDARIADSNARVTTIEQGYVTEDKAIAIAGQQVSAAINTPGTDLHSLVSRIDLALTSLGDDIEDKYGLLEDINEGVRFSLAASIEKVEADLTTAAGEFSAAVTTINSAIASEEQARAKAIQTVEASIETERGRITGNADRIQEVIINPFGVSTALNELNASVSGPDGVAESLMELKSSYDNVTGELLARAFFGTIIDTGTGEPIITGISIDSTAEEQVMRFTAPKLFVRNPHTGADDLFYNAAKKRLTIKADLVLGDGTQLDSLESIKNTADYTDTRYKRAETKPARPSDLNPPGWYQQIPDGDDSLWMTTSKKEGITGEFLPGHSWSDPVPMTGQQGPPGPSTHIVNGGMPEPDPMDQGVLDSLLEASAGRPPIANDSMIVSWTDSSQGYIYKGVGVGWQTSALTVHGSIIASETISADKLVANIFYGQATVLTNDGVSLVRDARGDDSYLPVSERKSELPNDMLTEWAGPASIPASQRNKSNGFWWVSRDGTYRANSRRKVAPIGTVSVRGQGSMSKSATISSVQGVAIIKATMESFFGFVTSANTSSYEGSVTIALTKDGVALRTVTRDLSVALVESSEVQFSIDPDSAVLELEEDNRAQDYGVDNNYAIVVTVVGTFPANTHFQCRLGVSVEEQAH